MAEVARLYIRVDADGKPYVAGLQDIERRTDDFARRTESSLGKWSKRAGIAIAAGLGAATVALGTLTTKAVSMTMTYDQALTNAISATGQYGEAAQEAKKQADALAQELGRKTAFSAKEAADAMYDLASKGYDVSDWAKTLPGIINLASATQSDLASTTELVTSTINQFGMAQEDSTRVADVYTKAIAATGATQEKLALSMRYVGPIAASMGWSLEQTTAVLGRLYDAGYLGEQAGTALRGAISALIDPSAEAASTLASLNVSADLLSTEGIEGVVRAMTESNATTADFAKVFGTEAAPAMLALRKYAVEGEESVDKLEETLKSAGGTAELVANEQLNTAAGQLKILKSSFEGVQIAIGKLFLPALQSIAEGLQGPLNKAAEFVSSLEDIEGWEGADFTGKIKIAWTKLEEDFTTWFEGVSPVEIAVKGVPQGVVKAELEFAESRATGEEKLIAMGAKIGRGAADLLLGILGATGPDSIWAKAGKAIAEGFWVAFKAGMTMTPEEQRAFQAQIGGQFVTPANAEEAGKRGGELYGGGFFEALWGVVSELWKKIFGDQQTEQDVKDGSSDLGGVAGAAMVGSLTPKVIEGIARALGITSEQKTTASSSGKQAGESYKQGVIAGIQGLGAQIGAFFKTDAYAYSAGKNFGGGLSNEELAAMFGFGVAPGDTQGLKPQTVAFWAKLHSTFPAANLISGYRASDPYPDHPSGTALDITVPGMQKALADAVVSWAVNTGLVRYAIWNYQTWWPGGRRTTYSHNAEDPHTDHIHIRTYLTGGKVAGMGGPSDVLINAQAGERVLSQEQSRLFETFVHEIGVLADETRKANAEQEAFNEAFLSAISERLDLATSYVSREAARYGMQRAEFAPGGYSGPELSTMVDTLTGKIENLDRAVAEAEAQLNEMKYMQMPQDEINAAAEALFDLRRQAADARSELEDLERLHLEQAFDRWSTAISQTGRMMDLLAESSNAYALQSSLFPQLMGQIGASYQASMDLMAQSTLPSDIMGYADQALGALSDMFGAEQAQLRRALDSTLDSIDDSQDDYEDAWQARSDALDDEIDRERDLLDRQHDQQQQALDDQLETLRKAQQAELKALNDYYDSRLQLLDDREREITREQQRNQAMRSIAQAEEELRILQGQGYYTEADIARMRDLEQQIQEQRDQLAQQEAAWEREDQRTALQRERDQAIERLDQQHELQQQALEDQIAAEEARLQTQYEAAVRRLDARRQELDREREMMQRHFEELQRQAQEAYQAEIDAAVAKYQQMMQAVIDQQNALLGEQTDYYNAGYTLGQQFAQGILASIPLIEQAGLAAAEAVSRYLELHSPAKAGPLAELDRWWRAFVPTLVRPLDTYQAGQAASAVAAGVRQVVARAEEVIRIEFAGDATGLDIRTLADIVEDRLKRKIDVRRGGLGRQL